MLGELTLPTRPPPPPSPCPRADDSILQGSIIGSERLAVRPDFLSQIQFLFQVAMAYEQSSCAFVLRWHHSITRRCSELKSFPINRVPHDTRRMCHSNLYPQALFWRKSAFSSSKKADKSQTLRSTVSGTFQYLSSDSHNNPKRRGRLFCLTLVVTEYLRHNVISRIHADLSSSR